MLLKRPMVALLAAALLVAGAVPALAHTVADEPTAEADNACWAVFDGNTVSTTVTVAGFGSLVDDAYNPAYQTAYAAHLVANPGAFGDAHTAGRNAGDDAVDRALGGDGDRSTDDTDIHLHQVPCPDGPGDPVPAGGSSSRSGSAVDTDGENRHPFWCPISVSEGDCEVMTTPGNWEDATITFKRTSTGNRYEYRIR